MNPRTAPTMLCYDHGFVYTQHRLILCSMTVDAYAFMILRFTNKSSVSYVYNAVDQHSRSMLQKWVCKINSTWRAMLA